jgi:hypothetical protein
VNIPRTGYVGVGIVEEPSVIADLPPQKRYRLLSHQKEVKMAKKGFTPEQIINELREAEIL